MAGTGQLEWNHAYDGCMKIYKNEDGSLGVLVYF